MGTIPIIHVHGALGTLAARPYSEDLTAAAIRLSIDAIRVVHEEITEPYERAIVLLRNAEMIILLGFGYNQTNVERLQPGRWPQDLTVYGTGYGLTDAEKTQIVSRLFNNRPFTMGHDTFDVLRFLRHHALLP